MASVIMNLEERDMNCLKLPPHHQEIGHTINIVSSFPSKSDAGKKRLLRL